jgi:hypothetical protein
MSRGLEAEAAALEGGPLGWPSGGRHGGGGGYTSWSCGRHEVSGGWLGQVTGLRQWRRPDLELGIWTRHASLEDLMVAWGSYRAKALRLVADDGDARGRRYLLEDVVVVLLSMPGFRVKTLVRWTRQRRRLTPFSLLRALSWSLGVLGCCVAVFSGLPVISFGLVVSSGLRFPFIPGSAL